jgi:hypothetical protein
MILILVNSALQSEFDSKIKNDIQPAILKDEYLNLESLLDSYTVLGNIISIAIMLIMISSTKYLANLNNTIETYT